MLFAFWWLAPVIHLRKQVVWPFFFIWFRSVSILCFLMCPTLNGRTSWGLHLYNSVLNNIGEKIVPTHVDTMTWARIKHVSYVLGYASDRLHHFVLFSGNAVHLIPIWYTNKLEYVFSTVSKACASRQWALLLSLN